MADIVTELQESVDRLNEAFYNSVGVLQRDAKPASVVEGADPSEGVDEAQVRETFQKMAQVVDRQNADDPTYRAMAPGYDGAAYAAALDLVLKGREQPSGYTEPLLHEWRARAKD